MFNVVYISMKKEYIDKILTNYDENIILDCEQREVVLSDNNMLMVIAGAGSGKTTTIAAKVKYLVEVKKIKPSEILIISLTNKAVSELKEIIVNNLEIKAKILTFHKFAYEILKQNNDQIKILSNQQHLISSIIEKHGKTRRIIKCIKKDNRIKEKLESSKEYKEVLCQLIINNINLIKTLNIDIKELEKHNIHYFTYLKEIYIEYNKILQENHIYDFDDLINKAINCNIKSNYKYVIVDEYQDISQNRLSLLEKIIKKCNSKTILVGDDFQTIFSFAGSKPENFLALKKYKDFKMLKIRKTYRNSQQIIDIAGSFVMKDKSLITKSLISDKKLEYPIKICKYTNNFNNVFEGIICEIINQYGTKKTILVLGRYKSDIRKINSNKFVINSEKIIYKDYPNVKIDFLTIHASKGLGYDNVILINLENGLKGFPSTIKNDKFTEKILGYKNNINEERRLLYVAITRTKNKFYAITRNKNESYFVKELEDFENVVIDYGIKK